jgi:hypothetical protein
MDQPHKTNLSAILPCFDGWVSPREDGALVIYSGRYYAPTVMIGPDAITSYSFEEGIEDESACNEIVLTYLSAEHDYTTPECEAWRDEDDIVARGRVASQTLANQVPSYTQARRLAKRQMVRLMAPYRGSVTTNQLGRAADGQRYIHLTIREAGTTWYDGPAEITALSHQQTGITFQWIAADPNIDAWNPATEEGEPAPVGNRVAGQPLDAPTITSATAVSSSVSNNPSGTGTADGGISGDYDVTTNPTTGSGKRIQIIGTGPNRDDLVWYARWRVAGSASWNESQYSDTDPGASVTLLTGFVPLSATIEVEIAYQVGDGRISDYSAPASVTT